ncbi:hypothetical protein MRX96_008471 [Rhipicephalus microplus]
MKAAIENGIVYSPHPKVDIPECSTEVTSSSSGHCSQDVLSVLNATTTAAMVDPRSNLTDMRKAPDLQPDDRDNTHRID